ncbi:MAG: protein kinase [Pirellulaceae bacterium]|nr:protein kinase [Pirellulaceae bacterium]
MSRSGCLDRERIDAYLIGTLGDPERREVRRHLADCPHCQVIADSSEEEFESKSSDLIGLLRRPVPAGEYVNEPECQRALAKVDAFKHQVPFVSLAQRKRHSSGETWHPQQLGQYQLLERLGRGGMGTVYKALHTKLRREVALKILPPESMGDASAAKRFYREMEAVGKLSHPHIVHATDAAETDGIHFLVMELVDGVDLARLVAACGPLPAADACELIRQAAMGLEHAHQHGMVHRDIKPSNLILNSDGVVKVLDLGLARLRSGPAEGQELTRNGQIMGTLDYMAPEQACDAHSVDIRADIYSLGCTLYELLTGQAPFRSSEYDTPISKMMAHAQKSPSAVCAHRDDVPEGLAKVIDRLLAKEPADRYATPAAVAEALEPFATDCRLLTLIGKATGLAKNGRRAEGMAAGDAESVPLAAVSTYSEHGAEVSSVPRAETPPAERPREQEETALSHAPAPKRVSVDRRRIVVAAAALLLLVGGGAILSQIVIRIKSKDGRVTEIKVPEGDTVEIEREGKQLATFPGDKAGDVDVKPSAINLRADTPAIAPGTALGPMAWVTQPATLDGVRSWTIATYGHSCGVSAMAYSPSGQLLATGGADGIVRLWDASARQLIRALVGHAVGVRSLAWSPHGNILASGDSAGMVRIWDGGSGRLLRVMEGPRPDPNWSAVDALAWSPNGKMLAVSNQLCDIESGQVKYYTGGEPAYVSAMAWSPDGKTLVSGHYDVRFWNVESAEPELVRTLEAGDAVRSMAWSPDGKMLAFSGGGLWDAESEQMLDGFEWDLVAWSPDGRTLVSKHPVVGTRLVYWDVASGRSLREIETSGIRCVAWSPDRKTVASSGEHGTVDLWHTGTGARVDGFEGHAPGFNCTAWSPDGKAIGLASSSSLAAAGNVQLYDLASAQIRRSLRGHTYLVRCVAWSPNGQTLASGSNDACVRIWDAASGQPVHAFSHADKVYSVAWAPDGKTLAVGTAAQDDPTAWLWDVDSGERLDKLEGHENAIRVVAWSPDGKKLAEGCWDSQVRLWDVESGKLLYTLTADAGHISCLAWSPDGKTLASGHEDKKLRLWDARSGVNVELFEHQASLIDVAWLADGRRLISLGADNVLRVWDTEAARPLTAAFPGVQPGGFSRDGRLLASFYYNTVTVRETLTGRPRGTIVLLRNDEHLTLSPAGHYRGSERVKRLLVYVVQTDQGQETLAPEKFAEKYGWKNDPQKASLLGTPSEPAESDDGE